MISALFIIFGVLLFALAIWVVLILHDRSCLKRDINKLQKEYDRVNNMHLHELNQLVKIDGFFEEAFDKEYVNFVTIDKVKRLILQEEERRALAAARKLGTKEEPEGPKHEVAALSPEWDF